MKLTPVSGGVSADIVGLASHNGKLYVATKERVYELELEAPPVEWNPAAPDEVVWECGNEPNSFKRRVGGGDPRQAERWGMGP